jgi:uncharacterized membrane protein HdeD (DUF308 family)
VVDGVSRFYNGGVGVFVFVYPYETTFVFIGLFTLYMLASGIIAMILGFRTQSGPPRMSAFILPGIAVFSIALIVFLLPGLAVLALIALVGTWSLLVGFTELLLAIQLRKFLRHKWALFMAGTLSFFAGGCLLLRPFYIVFFDS